MAREKKSKPIKAELYEENNNSDIDIDNEDNIYEDEDLHQEENLETDVSLDDEVYEEQQQIFNRAKNNKFMKIFNIIFVVAMLIMIIISIDVICITKYNVGPLFAIKTKTHKDGGTKEYYGLGYKIIKYNEINGRQDTQIGFWSMKYSTEPITIQDIDLAIKFQNNPQKTADQYYKQYVKISSTIKAIDKNNNKLILEYTDPDGKYTLEIECDMASKKDVSNTYQANSKVSVKGTINKFSVREGETPNSVSLLNCFI